MQIHIARNGENIGVFELEVLKSMALEGTLLPTDHAYVEAFGRWERIENLPSIKSALFPQAERIIPPPPPGSGQSTQLPILAIPALDQFDASLKPNDQNKLADTPDEMFQGFPRSYWHAYLGKNSNKFLDAFKNLPTIKDLEANRTRNPGEGLLEWSARRRSTNNQIFGFAWIGLIFGWSWLAYRKIWSAFIWFGVFDILGTILLSNSIHTQDPSTKDLIKLLVGFVGVLVAPSIIGYYLIHKRAQKVFREVEAQTNKISERITRIQEDGGTSILWFVSFCIYAWLFDTYVANSFL